MKKNLSILLTLAMCLALLPVAAFAAAEYTDTQGHWAEESIAQLALNPKSTLTAPA